MLTIKDFDTIVIVADNISFSKDSIGLYDTEPDRAQKNNVENLRQGFSQLLNHVILYDSPQAFLNNVSSHRNDIIFPYWHGEKSRNKQALIASICEAGKMVYIGADTYTNIVCCDKILSKDICRLAKIKTPKHLVVDHQINDIDLSLLKYPLIVKPTYEGSSIGISQDNLIKENNKKRVIQKINDLHFHLKQPIIIEEFIKGKEISLSIIGWRNHVKAWGAVERFSPSHPNYFDENIHSFEDKKIGKIHLKNAHKLISDENIKKLFNLFYWLDKVEYIRIDGKLEGNDFYCFELSHDTTLSPTGAFFTAFNYNGYDYLNVLKMLINNCLERYNSLHPN